MPQKRHLYVTLTTGQSTRQYVVAKVILPIQPQADPKNIKKAHPAWLTDPPSYAAFIMLAYKSPKKPDTYEKVFFAYMPAVLETLADMVAGADPYLAAFFAANQQDEQKHPMVAGLEKLIRGKNPTPYGTFWMLPPEDKFIDKEKQKEKHVGALLPTESDDPADSYLLYQIPFTAVQALSSSATTEDEAKVWSIQEPIGRANITQKLFDKQKTVRQFLKAWEQGESTAATREVHDSDADSGPMRKRKMGPADYLHKPKANKVRRVIEDDGSSDELTAEDAKEWDGIIPGAAKLKHVSETDAAGPSKRHPSPPPPGQADENNEAGSDAEISDDSGSEGTSDNDTSSGLSV